MNKKDLEADLKKAEAALKDIRAKLEEIDKPKPAGVIYDEPSVGDAVWVLRPDGAADYAGYSRYHWIKLEQGLLFYDEASAIHAGKVRAIRHRLAGFCAKAWCDAGKVIDWNDGSQVKICLGWNLNCGIQAYAWCETKFGDFHLPVEDLTELKKHFTDAELKLAITGEL